MTGVTQVGTMPAVGDLNGDGRVDEEDAQLFLHHKIDAAKFDVKMINGRAGGLRLAFAQGGDVLRERSMATW